MDFELENGQIITYNVGAAFIVACWNKDGSNLSMKEFHKKEDALKEYDMLTRPHNSSD